MSERNANRDLADTARMRSLDALRDDLERTQPMPVIARHIRSTEAALQSAAAWPQRVKP